MKDPILVDTGVIVEYLKTGKGVLPVAYEKFKMQITASTFTELLASTTFRDSGLEKEVMEFVKKYFEVLAITEEIALESAKILREKDVTLAIANVVATANVNKLKLLTDDKKPYDKIEGLSFLEL